MISVLLVDDHEVVRRGVRELLDRLSATAPQVAVLDVRMPAGNGVELCRELRVVIPDIACLKLTSFTDDQALPDSGATAGPGVGYLYGETSRVQP